ncbi:MAG: hypothetical protein ACPG4Z_06915 [Chitinophagales bacterium]
MSEEIQQSGEELSTLQKVGCFLIPIYGGYLYFTKKDENEPLAKEAGKLALIGIAVGVVLQVVSGLLL